MVQTRSNANIGTGVPQQGENSATGGRNPPITTGEAEALIQRVGITAEQFKEVLAALAPNREVVVEDVAGGPTGGKAGPADSQGKKKKVRRSQKKKATKPNGKAVMVDALSRLDEEDESSSFERMSAFDRLGDPKSKKLRTSAFERLQDTRSARKGDLRDTLKEKRGESTVTSKIGPEERWTMVEDKGAAELWRMRIMSCPLPDNFKTPQIKAYNGTTDPQDHLARFGANVVMYAYPEEIKCRCFLATLEGQACEWFHKLPNGSIDKWSDLAHKFLEHFASSRRQKLPFSHLLNVKIREGEQLREFINRDVGQGEVPGVEEEEDEPPVRKEKKSGPPVAEGKKRKDYGKGPNPTGYHANRHPVHAVQSLPAPPHSWESYGVQDAPKYCEYHRNSTHNTSECVTLKKEMDQLIARGLPPWSKRPSSSNRTWRRPPAPTAAITAGEGQEDGRQYLGRECDDLDEEERQGCRHLGCRFIMGGNTGGDSLSSRKKWKNMVYLAEVQRPPLPKRKKKEPLIFTDEDYPPVLSPHRDALVIKVEINNVVVHRTLVDTGSSVNVMYSNTFKELGLSRSDLKPIHTPLSGFTGDTIEAEGTITVKVGVGDGTHRLWVDMEFMVVQLDCAHHLILGRPGLEDLECVISPVHLCLKFNTPTRVGIAKGNQSLSRSCYVRATKSQVRVDENVSTICAAIQKEEGRPRAEPAEEVEEVSLDPVEPERKVKVGKTLPLELKEQLLEVLQAFKVLFAWGPEDMPGVDPKIICHRLAVDPTHKPVKQKKRFLSSERREFVTKQIEFKPRPAIKGQALADFVVECTAREVESSGKEPEGSWWTVYADGSSTTDASGGGVVAISPEGFKAYYSVRFRFKVSNNEAEYEALLCGLRLAASLKAERVRVRCDSKLIVGHVTGEFEAKDERMKKYRDIARELLKAFGAYRIEQVPREENAEADILSKLGPDSPDHIKAMAQEEELLEPSISLGQVLVITLKEPADWIDEITMYLLDGSLPTDPVTAKVVKRRAPSYTLECGRLYKRSYNGNNTYLVVAIDYFTKWVEAAPVPTITAEQMTKFVSKQILCRFGVPQQIITDNGTQFEARGFNEFLQSWGIKHNYAAVGYPQTNGQVENTNRTIVDGETPFSLTYGFEARAPAETSLLSYRVETFDDQEIEENLRAELHLIDERRERAYMRAENYRRQVKSYHDQRVRPRQFKMGDWVLRKREVSRPTDGGKFAKSFEGPYIITEVLADGTFRL
ncbi:unnamed protein product [Cuscuta campestris]|uniref:Uncharacterized protein n=1 Tax=Cuscuta campestris TaxID=132261 RepID=A0A484M1J9_9ASTE|nr:unnamed protein product [Cuscuta campestris]